MERDEKKQSVSNASERAGDRDLLREDVLIQPRLRFDSIEITHGMGLGSEHTNSSARRIHSPGGLISRTSSRQSLIDRTNIHIDSTLLTGNEPRSSHPETISHEEHIPATTESRRQIIEKEQRRRQELTDGYARLKNVLPLTSMKTSKVSLIERGERNTHIFDR